MSKDHNTQSRELSNETFSSFIRDRASLVRSEVGNVGYCLLSKFEKEILAEGMSFTPLQSAFLLLYFQPFATHREGLSRNGPMSPSDEIFLRNVPYQVGFDLDSYLGKKNFSKDDLLIVPCKGKAGSSFNRVTNHSYNRDISKGLIGMDEKIYWALRDGWSHSDSEYSFLLMDEHGVFAITSFDITKKGPAVKQIQGVRGARDKLDNWSWESALFHVVEDWAGKQGYKTVQLVDPKEVPYTKLDPENGHFVPLEKIAARYERVAKRRGLSKHETGFTKILS